MGDRWACRECGSKVAAMYVVCDVCGEPKEAPSAAPAKAAVPPPVNSHPGYAVRDVQAAAPADAEQDPGGIWCCVRGKTGRPRAGITNDGTVRLMDGSVLGYLNQQLQVVRVAAEDRSLALTSPQASPEGHLLGYVLGDQLYDARDEEQGQLDRGTGTVRDPLGSTVLDVDGSGCARGHTGTMLGQFQGLGYRQLPQIALYVRFLDRDYCDEHSDDPPEPVPAQPPAALAEEEAAPAPVVVVVAVANAAPRPAAPRPTHSAPAPDAGASTRRAGVAPLVWLTAP